MTHVRQAQPADLAAAADTLTAAFEHYPWTRHVLPESGYLGRLRALQRLYLGYAHEHGIVAVAGDGDGVIALLPPDAPDPTPAMVGEVIALHGDRIGRLDQTPPPEGAWRLETLGVRPERQGQGIASALIGFALSKVRARGGGAVALDTSDPRNVRLYERHGFQVTAHSDSGDGPPLWRMVASPEGPHRQGTAPAKTAAAALEAYLAATNTHEFDNVARLLAPDAVYFFGDATCAGVDEVRAYFERTWAMIPDETYGAEDVDWVARSEDAAVAIYTYHWDGTINGQKHAGAGRATNVFTRTSHGWRLTHEHLSSLPPAAPYAQDSEQQDEANA
ncbi:GNAT family N-acetyltransferase [uncultured Aeromicrobium sp.]|uniref:GNAT family N-acetyltransferase n=1 Tax=uncultured Aeromicrobium sp. TaxID=337820 RepID=UPI0025EC1F58|nr:GNAT family N-acetyltransferase [uncultured Aeromicrobium sp.]